MHSLKKRGMHLFWYVCLRGPEREGQSQSSSPPRNARICLPDRAHPMIRSRPTKNAHRLSSVYRPKPSRPTPSTAIPFATLFMFHHHHRLKHMGPQSARERWSGMPFSRPDPGCIPGRRAGSWGCCHSPGWRFPR